MFKKLFIILVFIIICCMSFVGCNDNYTELQDNETLSLSENQNYQTYKNEIKENLAICYSDPNAQYTVKYINSSLTEKEIDADLEKKDCILVKVCPVSIKTTYSYKIKEKEFVLKKVITYVGYDEVDDWITTCLKETPKRALNLRVNDYRNSTTEIKYKGVYTYKIQEV